MAAAEQGLPLQVFCRAVLREQKLQAQISSAAAADTTEEKVSRLEQLIADQRVENEVLWAELGEIETKHKAELAQQAKDYALGFAQLSQEPDEEDVAKWDLVPDLDDDDLSTLASYLTDASEGAIVFTDAALSSWANNQYPYVQKMQASLVALARAACTYREVEGRIGSRLAEWVHAEFGVRCSAQDEPLQKLNKATFVYEGTEYSREPHLKLDDSTTPDRVGRVYFGIDQTDLRVIVDHVGLKLYGL